VAQIQAVKRACMAAENVDVAARHSKMLAILVLDRRKTVAGPPDAGSVVEKVRAAWVR
jgi:hypothetical protein